MITSAIKKQTSVCCSISLNPYTVFQLGIMKEEKRKRKAILLLAYIADVSCLTNRSFYMRTLSLTLSLLGGLSKETFKTTIEVATFQLCNFLTIYSRGSIFGSFKSQEPQLSFLRS